MSVGMRTAAAPSAMGADSVEKMPFIDLQAQRRRLGSALDEAVRKVLDHGRYIHGPEVGELEERLAAFTGTRHAITCSSGTDALILILMGWNIGPGDAVIVPTFTFAATAEAVALIGATPVFCDVDEETFNIRPGDLDRAAALARDHELAPRAVIPVDLFGQTADYRVIMPTANALGLRVLADAAQSFGASHHGRRTGAWGDAAATSFFPTKPLGCYGDGGAVFTDDDALAATVRSLRVHGQGSDKYDNARIGFNGRLDTLQAAILLKKLDLFESELPLRQAVAERYTRALAEHVSPPRAEPGNSSVWAQYTIRTSRRDRIAQCCSGDGIPTSIYYPKPLHRQTAYRRYPTVLAEVANADRLAETVISLPMHPYLTEQQQDRVIAAVVAASAIEP